MNSWRIAHELRVLAKYINYGHGKGDVIWWFEGAKLVEHISEATIGDFHAKLMDDPDRAWRGRFDVHSKVLTIEPPIGPYFEERCEPPNSIMNKLYNRFKPNVILLDTVRGLKKVAKGDDVVMQSVPNEEAEARHVLDASHDRDNR